MIAWNLLAALTSGILSGRLRWQNEEDYLLRLKLSRLLDLGEL